MQLIIALFRQQNIHIGILVLDVVPDSPQFIQILAAQFHQVALALGHVLFRHQLTLRLIVLADRIVQIVSHEVQHQNASERRQCKHIAVKGKFLPDSIVKQGQCNGCHTDDIRIMQADHRDIPELLDAVPPEPQRHRQSQQHKSIAQKNLNGRTIRHVGQCIWESRCHQNHTHFRCIEQQQRNLAAFLFQLAGILRIPCQQQEMR